MAQRLKIHQIDATGVRDGSKFLRDDATWATPPGGSGSVTGAEVLMVDGATPPEPVTTEAGDDWLYEG